jgi:type II secretory pathway pseudopilin PulG
MRGFSFIETLIYLTLFSLLITGAIASLLSIQDSMGRIEASSRLTDEGHFVLERLRHRVERGDSINVRDIASLIESPTIVRDVSFLPTDNDGFRISFSLSVPTQGGNPFNAIFSETVFPLSP